MKIKNFNNWIVPIIGTVAIVTTITVCTLTTENKGTINAQAKEELVLTEFEDITALTGAKIFRKIHGSEYQVSVDNSLFNVTLTGAGKDKKISLIDRVKEYEYISE